MALASYHNSGNQHGLYGNAYDNAHAANGAKYGHGYYNKGYNNAYAWKTHDNYGASYGSQGHY